jgi:hypothetical protein
MPFRYCLRPVRTLLLYESYVYFTPCTALLFTRRFTAFSFRIRCAVLLDFGVIPCVVFLTCRRVFFDYVNVSGYFITNCVPVYRVPVGISRIEMSFSSASRAPRSRARHPSPPPVSYQVTTPCNTRCSCHQRSRGARPTRPTPERKRVRVGRRCPCAPRAPRPRPAQNGQCANIHRNTIGLL